MMRLRHRPPHTRPGPGRVPGSSGQSGRFSPLRVLLWSLAAAGAFATFRLPGAAALPPGALPAATSQPIEGVPGIGSSPAGRESPPEPSFEALWKPDLELERTRPEEPRPDRFDPGHLGFQLEVDGTEVPYRVLAIPALPGALLRIEASLPGRMTSRAWLHYGAGAVEQTGPGRWKWTAPERPGIYPLRVVLAETGESANLAMLVLHPSHLLKNGMLYNYRIGRYPETPLRGEPAYAPPAGFVGLEASDETILVSPHFTLGQFPCKQPGEPRYLTLSPALLLKLEAILKEVNQSGRPAATLQIMSGFRTPHYNQAIGNRTTYSRHLWGDASDIFVDEDGDGEMDDWNGDGRSDYRDARILFALVEKATEEGQSRIRRGGLGLYRRNSVRGPFVHVDARGRRARW